jgi:hypothetical protein
LKLELEGEGRVEQGSADMDYFSDLPTELLVMIIDKLSIRDVCKLRKVCRRANKVALAERGLAIRSASNAMRRKYGKFGFVSLRELEDAAADGWLHFIRNDQETFPKTVGSIWAHASHFLHIASMNGCTGTAKDLIENNPKPFKRHQLELALTEAIRGRHERLVVYLKRKLLLL